MEPLGYGLIATFVLLYGLVSKRLQNTIITDPIVFVLFGFFLSGSVTGLVTSKDEN